MYRVKKCENCINLDWFGESESSVFFVMEAINCGDLWDFIDAQGGSLPEEACRPILKQLVNGLVDLKRNKVIHRDMKPENILVHSTSLF
jgi:serine/threonine protein kinase